MAIGNSVNDEIREQQRKVLQEKGFIGRLEYFFYYYKWHVIIGTVVAVLLTSFIVQIVTKKDTALQVAFINGFPNIETSDFMADFASFAELDESKEEALLDASFYINTDSTTMYDEQYAEKIFIMSSAGALDVCIVDESYFPTLAEGGFLLDLSEVLTKEELTELKDKLFYHDSPNNMYEGVQPVGIEVSDAIRLVSTESFPNSKAYFCIVMNTEHLDHSLKFLDYLYTDPTDTVE